MSQSVAKLKELLFSSENEAIASLSQRIDAVFDRAGTTDRFQASVAIVLDGALRDAEVARHDEVANAIAPLIVKTVKAEIRNSTDELVEALYPATGRMVKAYVASAIKDLTDQINRRLEANPVMLRFNALVSGRSVGEIAIAQSQKLTIEDVFLIRRATGELLARWPEGSSHDQNDHVLGGILTAINEFTSEAFKAEGSALRQIDLGDARVYLRVSPTYLLAAKCGGQAPVATEQVLDDEFLALMDQQNAALDATAGKGDVRIADMKPRLHQMSARLEKRLEALQADQEKMTRGVRPLPVLATLIGVPLVGWLAWGFFVDFRVDRVRSTAQNVIAAQSDMLGYPAEIKVTQGGKVVTLSGLVPSANVKTKIMADLAAILPRVEIHDQLTAVPTGTADVAPILSALQTSQSAFEREIKAQALKSNVARAGRALERVEGSIAQATVDTKSGDQDVLQRLGRQARELAGTVKTVTSGEALDGVAVKIEALAVELGAVAAGGVPGVKSDRAAQNLQASSDPGEAMVELATRAASAAQSLAATRAVRVRLQEEAARFNAETARLNEETLKLKAQIAALPTPRVLPPNPRLELEEFARSHAIFFSEQTSFRDENAAREIIDRVAGLMKRDPALVRVIGFTDDAGTPAKNVSLGQARADTVVAGLIARGVQANRVVALRRTTADGITTTTGSRSANRRVEFEVGFIGEGVE
jgi:outer membrane protein OmpA-like peptidoglycan-associated protein